MLAASANHSEQATQIFLIAAQVIFSLFYSIFCFFICLFVFF